MHAYKYLAWRFALISLVPAAAYVYAAGWWTGLKVYLVFVVVGQSALAWTYGRISRRLGVIDCAESCAAALGTTV